MDSRRWCQLPLLRVTPVHCAPPAARTCYPGLAVPVAARARFAGILLFAAVPATVADPVLPAAPRTCSAARPLLSCPSSGT
ncbi:hypothetical protein B0H14DRAFT_2910219, partial [Mycena olivaceomarginata]